MARDDEAVSENPLPEEGKKPAKPPAIPNLSIDDDADDRPRKKPSSRDDDDDDDRPRKKSARDDDDDDDGDRPRKKKSRDDDDDDDDEDDRPRKKKSRDDYDDEDDDDRPRKKKRSRDDDDEDDDRRGKKKKSAGMPGMLLTSAIVSLSCGGLCTLMFLGRLIAGIIGMVSLFRLGFGILPGSVKFLVFATMFIELMLLLASIALLVGGIMLIRSSYGGKIPALGAPIALGVLALIEIVIRLAVIGGFHLDAGDFIICILTILIGVGTAVCNFLMLLNRDVNRALS